MKPHKVWVRGCEGCGELDLHSIFPIATMVDSPGWRCGGCGAGTHSARQLLF